ncbi:replication-relaxation family protein [Neobacillus vireti]|uniref:replication-relaxation family protein n=1 Tax=Neobacillus vireti TaxID=220686 RepID=UPI00300038DE
MSSNTLRKIMRQEEILQSFEVLRFATREQLQRIHNLKSDRNALKILNQMKEYFHIQVHNGMNVYYLSKKGRDTIGSDVEMKWSLQVEHHLLRNELYIHFNQPSDWRVEHEIVFKPRGLVTTEKRIIADASFTNTGTFHLLEIDRTQSMMENKEKINVYAELSPLLFERFNHIPVIIFYTTSDLRKKKLVEYCKEKGVKCLVYTRDDLR